MLLSLAADCPPRIGRAVAAAAGALFRPPLHFFAPLASILLATCAALPPHPATAAESSALATARASIRDDDLARHVAVLADDTFEGRRAGTRGGRAAGMYLRGELLRLGLAGGSHQARYLQSFGPGHRNVLALVPGGDPQLRHEVVVIGAHYDHVGYGTLRDSYGPLGLIHNGADDNASGTAALLEIAQALKLLDPPPRRTILLAFWDGEEQGLLGSKQWILQPTLPLDRVRMLLNLDMVGRLRNGQLQIEGSRSAPGLRRRLSHYTTGTPLWLDFHWNVQRHSDHWPFFDRNVPVLLMHTGKHADYHRPSDDAEKLDIAGMREVTRFVLSTLVDLADVEQLPTFRAAARNENAARRAVAERLPPPLPGRLGISWDSEGADGVRIRGVTVGTAAARAGLRPGDWIIRCDGHPIASGDQLRAAVATAASPAEMIVRRAGQSEPLTLAVQLSGKPLRVGISWRESDAEPGSVFLVRVVPGSPGARAGLVPLDRIYEVAGEDFTNGAEFGRRLAAAHGPLQLLTERRGRLRSVTLQLPPPPGDGKREPDGEQ